MRFANRTDAGQRLAGRLRRYANHPGLLVLALPRGGVPVAAEIARELKAPLDLFLVRKLGVPGHEELALGAIASGGIRILNDEVVESLEIPASLIDAVAEKEKRELARRERLYRGNRGPLSVAGRTVILVDDGLATGATMKAAVKALKLQSPERLVVAVPVGAPETCRELESSVNELVCLWKPRPLFAVGEWYQDFSQTTDEDVIELLDQAQTVVD